MNENNGGLCSQLTQGGSVLKRPCQSVVVGGDCAELRHSAKNLRTAWSEKVTIIIGGLMKNTGWIFRGLRTHTANTNLQTTRKSEFCIR